MSTLVRAVSTAAQREPATPRRRELAAAASCRSRLDFDNLCLTKARTGSDFAGKTGRTTDAQVALVLTLGLYRCRPGLGSDPADLHLPGAGLDRRGADRLLHPRPGLEGDSAGLDPGVEAAERRPIPGR